MGRGIFVVWKMEMERFQLNWSTDNRIRIDIKQKSIGTSCHVYVHLLPALPYISISLLMLLDHVTQFLHGKLTPLPLCTQPTVAVP